MKTWYMIFAAACAVAMPAFADGDGEGEEPAAIRVTSEAFTFKLRTGDGTAAMSSADLAAWPVTYRAGETVTLTSPAGASTTPVSGAVANGTTELAGAFNADGVWRLANSNGGRLKKREAPPIAYSGDDWKGDLTKASTITFTPPEGSGLEPTTWNKTGRSAEAFTFNKNGVWTVELTFADNTTRTAQINIQTAGFVLVVK